MTTIGVGTAVGADSCEGSESFRIICLLSSRRSDSRIANDCCSCSRCDGRVGTTVVVVAGVVVR